MSHPEPNISIQVDLTNPGQFFACCGLLELADRLWPGAEGWFEDGNFLIHCPGNLSELLTCIVQTELKQLDPDDETSSPMRLQDPFELELAWWKDELHGGKQLKVWAGRMGSVRIAVAMKAALAKATPDYNLLNFASVVYDPDQPSKKVEPYYFDSRRGANAQSLDIGFGTDSLKMTTLAHPVVEFLCLVGLQRFRPCTTKNRRVFEYSAWCMPLTPLIAASVINSAVTLSGLRAYRFENGFRTAQKKHKAFLPATPIGTTR